MMVPPFYSFALLPDFLLVFFRSCIKNSWFFLQLYIISRDLFIANYSEMQPEVRIAGKLMRFDVNINQITKSHSHINLIGAAHSMRRKTIEMYQNMDLSKISISNKSI